jgi:hypothetical protein
MGLLQMLHVSGTMRPMRAETSSMSSCRNAAASCR